MYTNKGKRKEREKKKKKKKCDLVDLAEIVPLTRFQTF